MTHTDLNIQTSPRDRSVSIWTTQPELAELREQLPDTDRDQQAHPLHAASLRTGIMPADQFLPTNGLKLGATHEFLSSTPARSSWQPPTLFLASLAARALAEASPDTLAVWVGRQTWPQGWMLGSTLLHRCVFIDSRHPSERLWAIDQAARSSAAAAVIADGTRLGLAESRRLQVAAEQGHTPVLLTRPESERAALSAAQTRWTLAPTPSDSGLPRWDLTLTRCKGAALIDPELEAHRWAIELAPSSHTERSTHGPCHVRLAADVGQRSSTSPDAANIPGRLAERRRTHERSA